MDEKRILEELIRSRRSVKPAQFGPGKVADEVVGSYFGICTMGTYSRHDSALAVRGLYG